MARKHSATNSSGAFDGSAAAPARAQRNARPRRANVENHSATTPVTAAPAPTSMFEDSPSDREMVARLAYSYWESRGCQGGSPEEDWLRAETEYRASRSAVLV